MAFRDFKQITQHSGGQPKRRCPHCGDAVVKGTASLGRGRELAYRCLWMSYHVGRWDDATPVP